jgi:nucleoside-diphosphate-sugar epimerase
MSATPIVLVTGATGFLGRHLVRELQAAGATVRGLSRSPASDTTLHALGVEPVRGDLAEPEGLAGTVAAGTAAVFHTAADTSTWSRQRERQVRINVEGTRALAVAALRAGVGCFVHTSSVSSFSHLVHGTLVEDTPRRGGESWINYERTKFLGEEAVRSAMRDGLPAIVCHPAHILGPGDTHNWSRLIALIDHGKLPGAPPGSGAFADAREIARAQVVAWQRGRAGQSYLMGGEHVRFLDLVARIGAALGRRVPARATPAVVLKAYARLLAGIASLRGREPQMTPEAATFTCHDLAVDSSKAVRELDYRITPIDTLLGDTIAWMRVEGMLAPR